MQNTRYSISAAARIIDKSRATISRHMKAGKLSYEVDDDGNKLIEASELIRVYGQDCDFKREETRGPSETKRIESQDETAAVKEMHERLLAQYAAQIEHLKGALEKAQDGQNRVTLLLENKAPMAQPGRRLWRR